MKNHLCVLSIIERVKKVGLLDQPFFVFLIIVVCIEVLLVRFVERVVQGFVERIGFV